jgi:hypothetical protein
VTPTETQNQSFINKNLIPISLTILLLGLLGGLILSGSKKNTPHNPIAGGPISNV